MRFSVRFIGILVTLSLVLTACGPNTSAPMPSATAEPKPELYLQIIWHQHQPFYAVDPQTGLVSAPWVRLHAGKDYVDMASMLEKYPQIHVSFNLTPSLIRQIEDFNHGQRDLAWAMTAVPASQLTDEQKTYLLQRFFDVNSKVIDRFPRYTELQQLRGGTDAASIAAALAAWTPQDFLDLQVLFNLAWLDPDYLQQEPLKSIADKERDFNEDDKAAILSIFENLVAQVIPIHKQLQDAGQIEVTFTPYAHPILPLLIDSDLAAVAAPDIPLPTRFTHGDDAIQQIERGMALYEDNFGRAPRGMWPAEGAVAQYMVGMVARAGVKWMVTDEGILAHSLGLDFNRGAGGVPANLTSLYRPYTVSLNGEAVTIFFRDSTLSNKVSFDYGQVPAARAVEDFMDRLHAIRDALRFTPGGPYVVTVILDGENAWENYENDGKDFLNGLYKALSDDETIKTVTPSEFLAINTMPLQTIPDLWAGSWDNASFETWIGEPEENRAWDYLGTVRATLQEYITGPKKDSLTPDAFEQAYQTMLAAEGSDWFWWFGSDKDSGNDPAFDTQFRETLGQVYDALGLARPTFLSVPIIQPPPLQPDVSLAATFTPTIDGRQTRTTEWDQSGAFHFTGQFTSLQFGFDKTNLYLRSLGPSLTGGLDIYFQVPWISTGTPFTEDGRVIGFNATHRLHFSPTAGSQLKGSLQTWNDTDQVWQANAESGFTFRSGASGMEIAVPLADLSSNLDSGDSLLFRIATPSDLLPASAPGRMQLPDLGRTTWVVDINDPSGDDHGPGEYTYPTDAVFKPGVFDLLNFKVGYDENNLVFRVEMRGPVENPWGSPNGLAIQLIDIYLDTYGVPSGNRMLRNGRNAALTSAYGWDYVLTLAGWNYGVFTAAGPETVSDIPLTIITDPVKNVILAKIPLTSIPGDPTSWYYTVAVLSNDGYGINWVRDVTPDGGQWIVGGSRMDTNHTRILDLLWPEGLTPSQETQLSIYTSSQADPASLSPDDFPQVLGYPPIP